MIGVPYIPPTIPEPISNHGDLNLNDGKNPHGTRIADIEGLGGFLDTIPEAAGDNDINDDTQNTTNFVSPLFLWNWFKFRILSRGNVWTGNNVFTKNIIPVISNLILNDSHHNAILLIKSNCTITIESSLRNDFVCDARVFNNITVNFTGTINIAESDGVTTTGKGMFTIVKDSGNVLICGDF